MYEEEYDAALAGKARYTEGYEDGAAATMLTMVQSLYAAGTPIKFIVAATGWTEEQIRAAVSEPAIN